MDAPMPPDLERLRNSTFAFYPPILNVEHNEWRLRKAAWSELLVANTKNDLEVWIPRRLLGEISSIDEPVLIVGLQKELEYKAGTVWPHERRVLEMPRMAGAPPAPEAASVPRDAHAPAVRRVVTPESRIGRLLAAALGIGLLACVLVFAVLRLGPVRSVKFTAADQDFLSLSRRDDYFSIVHTLGRPAEDHWRAGAVTLQYRLLWYPQRGYYVVLLGSDRNDAHYIGALDRNWRVVHYVDLPGTGDTSSLLRGLPRF